MYLKEKIFLFERIDQAIRLRIPGGATELAERFEISRSTFYRCIDEMRELGAPIEYDESSKSFYYSKDVSFQIGFLSKKELHSIYAGGLLHFSSEDYFTVSIFETSINYV